MYKIAELLGTCVRDFSNAELINAMPGCNAKHSTHNVCGADGDRQKRSRLSEPQTLDAPEEQLARVGRQTYNHIILGKSKVQHRVLLRPCADVLGLRFIKSNLQQSIHQQPTSKPSDDRVKLCSTFQCWDGRRGIEENVHDGFLNILAAPSVAFVFTRPGQTGMHNALRVGSPVSTAANRS